ncbi:class IV adenylate cyclase [Candidatus Woesearchaeota archaeon]|nr:class IV adenylate cyclase [Candidatus Woesearchaeota archaeon]
MNIEIEICVKLENFDEVRPKLEKIGKFVKKIHQIDTYLNHPQRDFMASEKPCEFLRIRNNNNESFSFDYHYCHRKEDHSKSHTAELEISISDPAILKKILESLNFKEIATVDKTREVWDCGDFEVVLDYVGELGYFMEIEAKKDLGGIDKTTAACHTFLKELNIQHLGFSTQGYLSSLLEKRK